MHPSTTTEAVAHRSPIPTNFATLCQADLASMITTAQVCSPQGILLEKLMSRTAKNIEARKPVNYHVHLRAIDTGHMLSCTNVPRMPRCGLCAIRLSRRISQMCSNPQTSQPCFFVHQFTPAFIHAVQRSVRSTFRPGCSRSPPYMDVAWPAEALFASSRHPPHTGWPPLRGPSSNTSAPTSSMSGPGLRVRIAGLLARCISADLHHAALIRTAECCVNTTPCSLLVR
ncbi:hypothetical protein LXA43DRAFT_336673 [Ganoderma leucocontextum]|nr:hypothetical protein LXA43DRAFT_336673 [Ganoderma leucocontextum]